MFKGYILSQGLRRPNLLNKAIGHTTAFPDGNQKTRCGREKIPRQAPQKLGKHDALIRLIINIASRSPAFYQLEPNALEIEDKAHR